MSSETPDIKKEIKKFTDDIVKVTKLLCDVRKEEILKIQPNVVYMKDGIDAMSCVTMEASPTRYCCTLKTSYVYAQKAQRINNKTVNLQKRYLRILKGIFCLFMHFDRI